MVPKTPFDVAREVREPLTAVESIALQALRQIAKEGRPATIAELCGAIGSDNVYGGTVPGIVRRLEQKGHITRERYQRGMRVCLVADGICTAPPANTAPHWRDRTDAVPTVAIHQVRQRAPELATQIEREARELGKPISTFLADLVYIGWHGYSEEKQHG